jgi:hypothetical protein
VQKFGLFVATLLVATVVWGVVFYRSLREYREYSEDYYWQVQAEAQRVEEQTGLHVDGGIPPPYWAWAGGGIVLAAGGVLLCAWILAAGEKLSESRRSD